MAFAKSRAPSFPVTLVSLAIYCRRNTPTRCRLHHHQGSAGSCVPWHGRSPIHQSPWLSWRAACHGYRCQGRDILKVKSLQGILLLQFVPVLKKEVRHEIRPGLKSAVV